MSDARTPDFERRSQQISKNEFAIADTFSRFSTLAVYKTFVSIINCGVERPFSWQLSDENLGKYLIINSYTSNDNE